MSTTNLQIRLPTALAKQLSKCGAASKSVFVRQAIEEKLVRERTARLERRWIDALGQSPDHTSNARAWRSVEAWGDK